MSGRAVSWPPGLARRTETPVTDVHGLSGGVQDPQLGQAVGQSLVFKRPQDGVVRLGGQVDEIATNGDSDV